MRWILPFTLIPALHAGTLYFSDFEHFTLGANNWAGTDGWVATDTTSGAQSIDLDLDPVIAFGKSPTLGFAQPNANFVTVAKAFNHNPVTTGLAVIEISCFVAIVDSTNAFRDDFLITIRNSAATPVAWIRFDNDNPTANLSQFGIWRHDGVSQFDTLVGFIHEQFFFLYIAIDLTANTWSADIEGSPLFTDETFTATGASLDFGSLAFEWDLTAFLPANHGDNYIAIDELSVRSYPIGIEPFTATGTRDPVTGHVTLDWPGEFGFDYQVEFSTDLENWFDTLPDSTFSNVTSAGPLSYTDTTSSSTDIYYRVVRSESP